MPYIVNHSDPTIPEIVISDGTYDVSTSLVLFGKNITNFGEYLNEDLLRLLENFASPSEPEKPVEGQLWYNTGESQLYIYDNGSWFPVGSPAGSTRIEFRVLVPLLRSPTDFPRAEPSSAGLR